MERLEAVRLTSRVLQLRVVEPKKVWLNDSSREAQALQPHGATGSSRSTALGRRALFEGPLAPLASCTVNWRLACDQTRCGVLATLSKPATYRSFLEPAATLPECAEAEALDGARLCGELLSMCVQRAGQPCTAIILFIEMPILVGSTCSTCFSIE